MSHYVCHILINGRKDALLESFDDELARLLSPFDENIQVPPYEVDCYCKQRGVRIKVDADLIKEFGGNFDTVKRTPFNKKTDENEKTQEKWKVFIQDWVDAQNRLTEKYESEATPDADCGECHGTGKTTSTYNPISKWDWWTIGGRWEGDFLKDYDPYKDERNIINCYLCKGTGDREDWVYYETDEQGNKVRKFKDKWAEDCNGCNSCRGTGKTLSFRLAPTDGNIINADELLGRDDFDKHIPYALITPDGEWHTKGKMLWFGMSDDKISHDEWIKEYRRLLGENKDYVVVSCDLHI